jgi:SNF2 family DNA or RNA helicase
LLEGLLAENQRAPTIIAYQFQEELAELRRRYPHAITLDDDNAIARWNRGEVELLLVHPKSAQYGLNLQAGGCRMVLLSLPWSLVDYEQLIGRLHRSGQRHTVWVYILITSDTIDARIWATLRDRRSLSDLALEVLAQPLPPGHQLTGC